jgi:phospho-N-acetylmuramoyl-pentapeptide-transferase
MLYHLFNYLDNVYNIPGGRLFDYISFRAGAAFLVALVVGIVFGKKVILYLQRNNIVSGTRTVKLKKLEIEQHKSSTPTMGGIIILLAVLAPVLLLANLTSVYTWLLVVTLVWFSVLGFVDDYIKVFKKDRKGLRGIFKIAGQTGIGIIVGLTLFMNDGITVRPKTSPADPQAQRVMVGNGSNTHSVYIGEAQKSTITTIPFFKNNEFDYKMLVPSFMKQHAETAGWVIFILMCIFVVMSVSNGVNLTDGLDGLAGGVSVFVGIVLGILAYLSNNIIYADYLQIMYIPNSGEVVVFMAALVGGLIGFLWYNTYPSQVFMGDTGSMALGGVIAVCAIIIHKELMIPILCGIFLAETCSVIMQVTAFKYSIWRYGVKRGIFLMAPLHHHYQKKGIHEPKIVMRFYIVAVLLAVLAVLSLKMR